MPTVFVRLPNHLGDACMCLPALELLARGGHALALVGKPWAPTLFEAYDWPVLAPRGSWLERIDALRVARIALRAERAVLFTNSIGSALEFRLAGFACAGYATEARRWLLANAIAVPAAWTRDMHTVEYYFELARRSANVEAQVPERLSLRLTPAAQARARALLATAGVDGPYTVLCPAAAGIHHGRVKAWTGYPELCAELIAHGVRVVACPGPGEREVVAAALPGGTILPETDVATFAALLRGAQLVVANDSGPSHVAAAVGAPLIAIFGVTDPVRTRPWTPDADLVGGRHGWPEFGAVWERVRTRLARAVGVPS
ncbi:MAG: glycosyltransferase family 9 protein [Burkholderiaceae bacterium]